MPVKKEDIVGNEELVNTLWKNFLLLGCYDPDKGENPVDPASVIFTYGDPGCGKTYTAHGVVRSFADFCKEKKIPLWAFTHSMTDFASHYQNLTANNLSKLASDINEFPGIVLMYIADADTLFLSRQRPDLTSEQLNTLSVYFKMFDGSLVRKNGKFMSIMDANYIEGIDDATKSRLFDEIIELKRFSKPEYFEELVRRILTKGAEDGISLSEKEWAEVGKYVYETPLSNREVTHVVRQLRRGLSVPEGLVGKPYEEIVKYRNEQLKAITKDTIIGKFENYIATRKEIEETSREARGRDGLERFLQYLTETPKKVAENGQQGA